MSIEDAIAKNTDIVIKNREVELPDDKPATESLTNLVEFLFSSDYLDRSDIPIKAGHSRYLINSEPTHQDGGQMKRPYQVSDDIFIERNFNKEEIQRKTFQLFEYIRSKNENNN